MTDLEDGFYWVRYHGCDWEFSQKVWSYWFVAGITDPQGKPDEIDPRRIVREGGERDTSMAIAAPDMYAALEEARRSLDITRANIMVEMKRDEAAAYRWEGVPELLKERMNDCDAALSRARGETK